MWRFLLAGCLLVEVSPAWAQATDDAGSIIVTATRRETRLLQTPMSISVIGADTLAKADVTNFADFARLVPGLSYIDSGPGNKRYALRGLQSAGEPEVALYYDEIPVSGLPGGSLDTGDSQPDVTLWDVDRIEVLRGPQGTLYGNGSEGGAIRIISKRPVLDAVQGAVEATGAVTSGGQPSERLKGMINLPVLKDILAVRLTGYMGREGGWIDAIPKSDITLPQRSGRNLNDERTYGGRASIALQANTNWTITSITYYQRTNTSAFDLYPAYATANDPYVSASYVNEPWRDRLFMTNLISTNDFGWARLITSGSYQRRTLARAVDTTRYLLEGIYGCTEQDWGVSCSPPDTLPAVGYSRERVSAWSAEIRLTSKRTAPFQWNLGSFFQDSSTWRRSQVAKVDAAGDIQIDPTTGDALNRLFERDNRDVFRQYAIFGEGSYDITRSLSATIGLRWFDSYRSDQQVLVQQFFAGAPVGAEPFQQFSQSALFQKYELSYKLGSNGLIYVQASQGFRAGGPNFPGGFATSAPPYKSDSVWDYEIGWKKDLGRRLYWTAAIFHIDWKNLQQLVPTTNFNYIANAGRARSDGFETELNYRPVSRLTLSGGVTYNNARLIGPQPIQINPALQLHAGDRLANVPDWMADWAVDYTMPVTSRLTMSARFDASYQSGKADLVAVGNPAYFRIGSATLCNMHVMLTRADHWHASLDVANLLNAYAPLSAKSLDSNFARTVVAARPRTLSLSLGKEF